MERELNAIVSAVTSAVGTGAGLPEIVRIASRAMDACVAVFDASGAAMAIAGASRADERELISGKSVEKATLKVSDKAVGELRFKGHGKRPAPYLVGFLTMVIALEVERHQVPEQARSAAASDFFKAVLTRELDGRSDIVAKGRDCGVDVESGGQVICVRVRPKAVEVSDWRSRASQAVERAARSASTEAVSAYHRDEIYMLLPAKDRDLADKVAGRISDEFNGRLKGFNVVIGLSRATKRPEAIYQAGSEALLAANVAEAGSLGRLSYEETGSYRLLLPAFSEDPAELKRFFDETIGPLVAYDEQYQTGLVATLESYLELDAKIEATAQRLFAHRHTIRYRLERIRELTGLDVSSSEGREKLGLGLKAMRVLGISPPRSVAEDTS